MEHKKRSVVNHDLAAGGGKWRSWGVEGERGGVLRWGSLHGPDFPLPSIHGRERKERVTPEKKFVHTI